MILNLSFKDNSIDGKDVRAAIIANEINLVTSLQDMKELDPLRKTITPKVQEFRNIINSNEDKGGLIDRLSNSIHIDVLGGMYETMDGLYSFAKKDKLTSDKVGMSKDDYAAFKKSCANISSLYGSWSKLSNQLYGKKITDQKNQLNIDAELTGSDGKSVNIMSTIADEDTELTSETDTTIKNNFKIYLNFLYNALVAARNSKDVEGYVYGFLSFMWFEDTKLSVEPNNLTNKKVLPIVETASTGKRIKQVLSVDKSRRKYLYDANKDLVYKNLIKCAQKSCVKSYAQYKSVLSDAQNSGIGRDCFVFTRYIYRMYQIIPGFKLFEQGKIYDYDELSDIILNPDNPDSLYNKIPPHKYMPEFFNKVNTLKEWYETPVDAFTNEYKIDPYLGDSNTKIHAPAFDILNSSSICKYPQTLQSSVGSVLNFEQEKKQLLQLCHLTKLLGTSLNSNNIYNSLYEEKFNRVILLEPTATLSSFKNNKDDNSVSGMVTAEINKPTNAIIYSTKPTDPKIFDVSSALYMEPSYVSTPDAVISYIDKIIDKRIEEIADIYLDYYYANNWNFPFITKRESLLEKIKHTKKSDMVISDLSIMKLLGDAIILEVYIIDNKDRIISAEPTSGILTGDYKIGVKRTVYIPRLIQVPAGSKCAKREGTYILGIKVTGKEED